MKDMTDVHQVLRAELNQWFKKQIQNEYDDYYLYYLPTTAEHDGGFLITKDLPANSEYCLAEKVRKDLTIDQNHSRLSFLARRLPILAN